MILNSGMVGEIFKDKHGNIWRMAWFSDQPMVCFKCMSEYPRSEVDEISAVAESSLINEKGFKLMKELK